MKTKKHNNRFLPSSNFSSKVQHLASDLQKLSLEIFFQQTRRVLAAVDTIPQPPITLFSHYFIEKTQRLHTKGLGGGREERGGGHFLLFTLARDFTELLLVLCSFPTWWMWLCPSHGQTRVGHVLWHLGPLISVKKISHVFVTLSEWRHVVGIWGSHWRITGLILVWVASVVGTCH
jgi:hypothetical protein